MKVYKHGIYDYITVVEIPKKKIKKIKIVNMIKISQKKIKKKKTKELFHVNHN